MAYCPKCGSSSVSPSGLCLACGSFSHPIGSQEDVPCQRCGMYLPEHELKMWNSRLYCAYCIMDIQDEESMMHKRHEKQEHPDDDARGQEFSKTKTACERCGKQTEVFYMLGGKKLCHFCYNQSREAQDGAASGMASLLLQLRLIAGNKRPTFQALGSRGLQKQDKQNQLSKPVSKGTGFFGFLKKLIRKN